MRAHFTVLVQEAEGVGEVAVSISAGYTRAGRYIVRATATAFDGLLATHDLVVMVRKSGDVALQSKCCRNTPSIVAGVKPAFRGCW